MMLFLLKRRESFREIRFEKKGVGSFWIFALGCKAGGWDPRKSAPQSKIGNHEIENFGMVTRIDSKN